MKKFYIMNLDMRRIAILLGGALTALGLALFVGMAIGRGQGEKNARVAAEEGGQSKLPNGLESADKLVLSSGPSAAMAVEKFSSIERPPAVPVVPALEPKAEIPLREDPLVQGPPKNSAASSGAVSSKHARNDRSVGKSRHKKKQLSRDDASEVSGSVEHSSTKIARSKKKRQRRALSNDADDPLTAVAGTAKAERIAATRYTIQVAAFKRASEANSLITKLKSEGIKARSEKNGNYFLVTVGRTSKKSKLEKAMARLKELEYDAYIRKLSPPSGET